jgi:hypothetical protein
MKAPTSLKVPNPSLAQMAMEPHSNIPMLPFAKILYLVPIDVQTPTPTKVLEPLLAEVLVPPSVQAPTPPFIRYLPHPLLRCLQFLPSIPTLLSLHVITPLCNVFIDYNHVT